MTINLTYPYSEGYRAFMEKKIITQNPYKSADEYNASEWDSGWTRAYNEYVRGM